MENVRLIDANALETKAYLTRPATLDDPNGGRYVVKVEDIENAPTIDPESLRPTGQWLSYSDDKFCGYDDGGKLRYRKCRTYECCFCGRNTAVKSNYCPNCGAKMEV